MDIKELNSKLRRAGHRRVNESNIDGQKINTCIDVLYELEDKLVSEDDISSAQMIKDARLVVEDYRRDYIMQM